MQRDHVSIRARHRWRAIRGCSTGIAESLSFQSAPAIDGGRSLSNLLTLYAENVSIRARHRWRAIPSTEPKKHPARKFQSAPAIDGGRSPDLVRRIGVVHPVSIRARHRWRAIPPATTAAKRGSWSFQSAPAIDGGRSEKFLRAVMNDSGFNPRPPSMAGDPPAHASIPGFVVVSIRARHRWRAIPCWPPGVGGDGVFQSAPAIDGGRSRERRRGANRCHGFNPRPPSMAGDPAIVTWAPQITDWFQSAPAIDGGRSQRAF